MLGTVARQNGVISKARQLVAGFSLLQANCDTVERRNPRAKMREKRGMHEQFLLLRNAAPHATGQILPAAPFKLDRSVELLEEAEMAYISKEKRSTGAEETEGSDQHIDQV